MHAPAAGPIRSVPSDPPAAHPLRTGLLLGALGVVYGDIGTSPLYAFRESLKSAGGAAGAMEAAVLGILSLIVWALVVVVTLKYLLFVMRADNQGEGGIMALLALALPEVSERGRRKALLVVPEAERVAVAPLTKGFSGVTLRFGFFEKPDVLAALTRPSGVGGQPIIAEPNETSFFLGRELPVPTVRPDLNGWQAILYGFLTRNAVSAPEYYLIPPERVVELGTRVEL